MLIAVVIVTTILILSISGVVAAVLLTKDAPVAPTTPVSSFDFSGLPTTKPPATKPVGTVPQPISGSIAPISTVTTPSTITPTTCTNTCPSGQSAKMPGCVCECTNVKSCGTMGVFDKSTCACKCFNDCNGGVRNSDCSCLCTGGRTGVNCEIPPTLPPAPCNLNCGANGVPSADCKTCVCANQYTGAKCEIPYVPVVQPPVAQPPVAQPSVCTLDCGANGVRQTDCTCRCINGWSGATCTKAPVTTTPVNTCTLNCGANGQLLADCTCRCLNGWSGATCTKAPVAPTIDPVMQNRIDNYRRNLVLGNNAYITTATGQTIVHNWELGPLSVTLPGGIEFKYDPSETYVIPLYTPPVNDETLAGFHKDLDTGRQVVLPLDNNRTAFVSAADYPINKVVAGGKYFMHPILTSCPSGKTLNTTTNTCNCTITDCGPNGYSGPDCNCACVGGWTGTRCSVPPTITQPTITPPVSAPVTPSVLAPVTRTEIDGWYDTLRFGGSVDLRLANNTVLVWSASKGPISELTLAGGLKFKYNPLFFSSYKSLGGNVSGCQPRDCGEGRQNPDTCECVCLPGFRGKNCRILTGATEATCPDTSADFTWVGNNCLSTRYGQMTQALQRCVARPDGKYTFHNPYATSLSECTSGNEYASTMVGDSIDWTTSNQCVAFPTLDKCNISRNKFGSL